MLSALTPRLDAPGGREIVALGTHLMSTRAAAPLDDAGAILRWSDTTQVAVDGSNVGVDRVSYLLPVPGDTKRGLLFQATILRTANGVVVDDAMRTGLAGLCDAIVATVRWKNDADANRAEELAVAITPSPWPPTTTPFTLAEAPGWRVSVALQSSEADTAGTGEAVGWVRTIYVFAVRGFLAIAQLSPATPAAAGATMALTERLLPTIEINGLDERQPALSQNG